MKTSPFKWSLIELTVGIGLTVFFEYILQSRDIALTLLGISILFSLSSFIIMETLSNKISQQTEFYNIIKNIDDKELFNEAIRTIENCKNRLIQLKNGTYELSADDLFYKAIQLLRESKKDDNVKCVYIIPIHKGKEYEKQRYKMFLEENKNAIERGVNITRIFIETESYSIDEIEGLLTEHKKLGVNVLIARNVPEYLQEDYMIFYDRVLLKAKWSIADRIIVGSLIANLEIVEEQLNKFDRLKSLSSKYEAILNDQ